jgi:hypothetical protein
MSKYDMAALLLENEAITQEEKIQDLKKRALLAKNEKQEEMFGKALSNVEGWVAEFREAAALLRKQGWISVDERLPDEGGRYWCYIKELTDLGWSYFQWNCAYCAKEKRFTDSTLTNGENVTHWMPLPLPPNK